MDSFSADEAEAKSAADMEPCRAGTAASSTEVVVLTSPMSEPASPATPGLLAVGASATPAAADRASPALPETKMINTSSATQAIPGPFPPSSPGVTAPLMSGLQWVAYVCPQTASADAPV